MIYQAPIAATIIIIITIVAVSLVMPFLQYIYLTDFILMGKFIKFFVHLILAQMYTKP
jgi:hypothetical protein